MKAVRTENIAAGPVLDYLIARDVFGARAILQPENGSTRWRVINAVGDIVELDYWSSCAGFSKILQDCERVDVCEVNAGEYYAQAPSSDGRPASRGWGLTAAEAVACCVAVKYSGSWCSVPPELYPELNGDD